MHAQFFKMHDLEHINPSVPQISSLYLRITYPSSHQRSVVRIKLYNEIQKLTSTFSDNNQNKTQMVTVDSKKNKKLF